MKTHRPIRFAVLLAILTLVVAGCGGAAGVASPVQAESSSTSAPEPFVAPETPPGPDPSVDEILVWAQTARARWTSIHVTGRVGAPGNMVPFVLDVAPETALSATSPAPSPGLEERMAEYSKSNPTLMRPGEESVVDDPLDYVINPSYWLRKELGLTAQEVLFVGMTSVSGRAAFHLQATFPADLAKEAFWDVFVDRDTGIIARFRVNPLPGEEGYEQIVETVSVSH